MKTRIAYRIRVINRLANTLYRALQPDTYNLPRNCRALVEVRDEHLYLELECSSVSKLLALNNSFISILLMLLDTEGVFRNERENTSTRSTTINNTIPDTQRTLC